MHTDIQLEIDLAPLAIWLADILALLGNTKLPADEINAAMAVPLANWANMPNELVFLQYQPGEVTVSAGPVLQTFGAMVGDLHGGQRFVPGRKSCAACDHSSQIPRVWMGEREAFCLAPAVLDGTSGRVHCDMARGDRCGQSAVHYVAKAVTVQTSAIGAGHAPA